MSRAPSGLNTLTRSPIRKLAVCCSVLVYLVRGNTWEDAVDIAVAEARMSDPEDALVPWEQVKAEAGL